MQRDPEHNRYDLAVTACLRAAVWQTPCDIGTAILNDNAFWQAAYRQSCGHLLSVWAINQGLPVADVARQKYRFSRSISVLSGRTGCSVTWLRFCA